MSFLLKLEYQKHEQVVFCDNDQYNLFERGIKFIFSNRKVEKPIRLLLTIYQDEPFLEVLLTHRLFKFLKKQKISILIEAVMDKAISQDINCEGAYYCHDKFPYLNRMAISNALKLTHTSFEKESRYQKNLPKYWRHILKSQRINDLTLYLWEMVAFWLGKSNELMQFVKKSRTFNAEISIDVYGKKDFSFFLNESSLIQLANIRTSIRFSFIVI